MDIRNRHRGRIFTIFLFPFFLMELSRGRGSIAIRTDDSGEKYKRKISSVSVKRTEIFDSKIDLRYNRIRIKR